MSESLFFSMNPIVKKSDLIRVLLSEETNNGDKEEIKEIVKSCVGSRRNVTFKEFSDILRILKERQVEEVHKEEGEEEGKEVKDLNLLSVKEVSELLRSKELNSFVETFRNEEIDGDMLMDICEEDLEELHLGTSVERKRLLSIVDGAKSKKNKKKRKLPCSSSSPSSPKFKVQKRETNDSNTTSSSKHLSHLSVEDLSIWLRDRDLNVFVNVFLDLEITGDMLVDISDSDMNELSIGETKSQRAALFRAIKESVTAKTATNGSTKIPLSKTTSQQKRPLESLSAVELGSWLESQGFGNFGNEFMRCHIDGDLIIDLRIEDSEDFPSLRQASDWKSQWKSLMSTIQIAYQNGCVLIVEENDVVD
jgi:hypothetical protein